MKKYLMIRCVTWLVIFSAMLGVEAGAVNIEKGVSRALAEYRARNLRNIEYALTFTVPADKDKPVSFFETLRFWWTGDEDLQIDFQGDESQLDGVIMVNGKAVDAIVRDEHIIIPQGSLRLGNNKVMIGGYSSDKALNRHDDYMYTLFVPDQARSAFPCFDQPDLKANFELELELPEGWVSISNDTQHLMPTYLFSFTAGRFQVETATRYGRQFTALYRETDPDKVAQLPTVFDQVALSLSWMEHYTGLAYPFEKYAFVVLPGYQFGGMEHPGCIQFNDKRIFLGPNPSPDEEMNRLNLIAHETAHMWFGDLVTMRWFDDVWTKEVFANFLADKISRQQFPAINHDLAFIKTHYPAAIGTDRTLGAHPIRQPLDNLNQAGLLYGNMIYHKAPIMMQKLEQEIGYDALRKGLRAYLRKFPYGNATWDDLVAELDRQCSGNTASEFSRVWVEQKGLPTFSMEMVADRRAALVQQDPYGRGLVWKQPVAISYNNGSEGITVHSDAERVMFDVPASTRPILNSDGAGYGRFSMDQATLSLLADGGDMTDEVNRYGAVINLYENYHLGNLDASSLLGTLMTYLERETNELIASTLCSYIDDLCGRVDADQRHRAEERLWQQSVSHGLQSVRQALLRQLSVSATAPSVVEGLRDVWAGQTSSLLSSRDYTLMAYHLAIVLPHQWRQILDAQRSRLTGEDELSEFDFVSRACDPDEHVQQHLFDELLLVENRRVEPWVRTMLALLNDPTREPVSNRYLEPGLDALEEIQRTGDIFFPGYWLSSLLGGHRSPQARDIVQSWIDGHQSLAPALMNKLLENAYWILLPQ